MTRTIMDLEEELAKIWGLVGELSEQLSTNRALVVQLKSRSDNIKGQATHVGAGFPLRRFNLDISDEEFSTELEKFASHLVLENQQLQYENKQLTALLKEYETTLETVMGKFRGVAHATQQHELSLHSYYTSLLQQLQTAHASAQLHDDTTLSLLLSRLSVMLRTALRVSSGEEVDLDLSNLPSLPGLGLGLGLTSGTSNTGQSGSSNPSISPPLSPTRSATSVSRTINSTGAYTHRSRRAPPHFPGSIPGSTGGYKGTDGQADWALEREMEIYRLEAENASLRDMLQVAKDSVLPDIIENAIEDAGDDAGPSPEPEPRSRKGSLTVEELEADAEKEEEVRQRMAEIAADPDNPLVDDADGDIDMEAAYGTNNGPGVGASAGGGESFGSRMGNGLGSNNSTPGGGPLDHPPVPGPQSDMITRRRSSANNDHPPSRLLPSTNTGRRKSIRRLNPNDASLSSRRDSSPAEGMSEFLEKVPEGNTGLAEHFAAKDSAPSHIATQRPGQTGSSNAHADGAESSSPRSSPGSGSSSGAGGTRPVGEGGDAPFANSPKKFGSGNLDTSPTTTPTTDQSPTKTTSPSRSTTVLDIDSESASGAIPATLEALGPTDIDVADAGLPMTSTEGEVSHSSPTQGKGKGRGDLPGPPPELHAESEAISTPTTEQQSATPAVASGPGPDSPPGYAVPDQPVDQVKDSAVAAPLGPSGPLPEEVIEDEPDVGER